MDYAPREHRGRDSNSNGPGAYLKDNSYSKWTPAARNHIKHAVNLPTLITGALTPEQLDAYQAVYRIDEITQKISRNDVIPQGRERSPSPPPMYDSQGRRTNTREQRYKKLLEEERHKLVDIAVRVVPHYVAPAHYRRRKNLIQKYFLPVKEHPEINFIGLLLGPRGNTLRKLQQDSGAKIQIRGKGSVKEGKNRAVSSQQNNFDEPLHCIITADDEEKIEAGMKACKEVIDKAIFTPEGQNDLKRGQLRELAELNGTLREDDDRPCPVCGIRGHKRWECPEKDNFLSKIVCRICGQPGHFARDCKQGGAQGFPGTGSNSIPSKDLDNMLNSLNASYNNGQDNSDQPPWKRRNISNESPLGPVPTNSGTFLPPPPPPSSSSSLLSSSIPAPAGLGIIPPTTLAPPPGLVAPPGLPQTSPPPPPPPGMPAPPPGLPPPPPPPE